MQHLPVGFPRKRKKFNRLAGMVDARAARPLNCAGNARRDFSVRPTCPLNFNTRCAAASAAETLPLPDIMRQTNTLPRCLRVFISSLLLLATLAPAALAAQTNNPAPRREQLLNGLPILLDYRPGDQQALLKLRIGSGAAFDLAGKEGLMTLLSDILFPDPNTRQFVTEELGGQMEVTTDYDHIDVLLSGRASEFERLAELLRNAVVNTRIVADEVGRLRAERLKGAQAAEVSPALRADHAVAARLFGRHPYARLINGTPESLARIERADLLLARDRFLTADNARLVLIGGVEPARAMRVFRQFLGAWRKSETLVPATFRQPDPPDARTLIIDQSGADTAEVRLALRGLARTDRDHVAASLLAALARTRWQAALTENKLTQSLSVRHEAYAVAGLWQMSAQAQPVAAAQTLEAARATLRSLVATPPTTAELDQAKRAASLTFIQTKQPDIALADEWLDVDRFNTSNADEQRALDLLTAADVQRVAVRLFRDAPTASVAVGPGAALRNELAHMSNGTEVFGASAPKPAALPRRP